MAAATTVWRWLDTRLGLRAVYKTLLQHPVPRGTVGKAGWYYVFGVATLTAFSVEVATGIALATVYVPSTDGAYDSLNFITHEAFLGSLIRGSHYYGASAMVILLSIHMARVFLTGSFKFPREMNWLSGVVLLLLTFGMLFTGQLLRWDEDAIGSALVAAEQAGRVPIIGSSIAHVILGGDRIGGATLTRFFALHVFILPGIMAGTIGLHLALILKHGISEPARAGQPVDPSTYQQGYWRRIHAEGRPYFPDAIWRELVFATAVVLLIVALAAIIGPKGLKGPPDPTNTDVNPRPDWYLLWAFAFLAIIPKAIEDYAIVLAPLLTVVVLFALPFIANRGERSLDRRPWAAGVVTLAVLGIGALLYTGSKSPWAPAFDTQPISAQTLGVTSGDAYDGSRIFLMSGCQYCHNAAGQGGTRGPELTHVVSRLTPDQIRERILASPEGMPSYNGALSPDEIAKIIAFLQLINEKEK
jgi:ubiquinol-cytochrome c reductase cytochrome b subunit